MAMVREEEEDGGLFGDSDEESPTTSSGKKAAPSASTEQERKFLFRKELKAMMYGFGDDKEPYDKSLELLESIVLHYIKALCEGAKAVGRQDRIQLEDIHYYIRRDPRKFARVKDLLNMNDELKNARKQFADAKGDDV